MGRMTRAKKAEAAERMHIDEDAVLDLSQSDIKPSTPEPAERAVLGDIAPNSAEAKGSNELMGRKTRSKKNGRAAAETEAQVALEENKHEDETSVDEEAARDALETTTNETMERLANLRITSIGNNAAMQLSGAPTTEHEEAAPEAAEIIPEPSNEKTATEEASTPVAARSNEEAKAELPNISIETQPQVLQIQEKEEEIVGEEPSSPVATAMPKVIKGLRDDTPSKRSTSNKENVEPGDPVQLAAPVENTTSTSPPAASPSAEPTSPSQYGSLSAVATQSATSPSARRRSSDKLEDPIEALDSLDEAVEKVSMDIPDVLASPEQKRTSRPIEEKEKPKKMKAAPVVRLTKAAAARLSMAQGTNKDEGHSASTARPRPSTMLGRTSSVRQSVAPTTKSTASNGTTTTKKPSPKPKKETVIPHSKPRPVSLSFPTPPPAAKSSKAPTRSTFQLPGEAVAAKLKAAREERLKREAAAASSKTTSKAVTEEKKPAFKARPAPNTLKKTPSVRHTAASRARESIMTGDAAPKPATSSTATGHKRSNTVATSRPRPSTAPAAAAAKVSQPSQLTVQKRARPSSMQISSNDIVASRNASSGASRPSTAPAARIPSTSSKGKEVYARASAARNAAENEKREKEDAARKARAAAAERGRAASREWAEKQKVKKMVAKVEGSVAKA